MVPSPQLASDDAPVTRVEFEELRRAVDALEERLDRGGPGRSGTGIPDGDGALWALDGLRERLDDPAGGVLLTGSAELGAGGPYAWQQGATTASLLEADWSQLAPAFDALGHPVRLQLLQLVAQGVCRTAELAEAEGLGTTGQLHHHLRQLVGAGWLRSTGRGTYEIPAPRVIPLLVVLLAVER